MYGSEEIRTDKHGNHVECYSTETDHGRLLGIDVYGNAAYATDDRATLAVLDDRGELRVPPRERWLAAEFPLAETGFSPGDYVLYVAKEAGPWRVLADAGHEGVANRGVDPERVVADGRIEADVDALVERVSALDGWDDRAEPAGELRQAAMDRPEEVAEHVGTLVSVLSEGDHVDSKRTEDSDDAPYHGLAARSDLAFAVARAIRGEPSRIHPVLGELLALVAAGRDSTADHDRHLLDALDVAGRAEPAATAAALATAMNDGDPAVRRRTLYAVYRLEHRHPAGDHPLLSADELRGTIEALASDPDATVREAAESVRTIHGFHHEVSSVESVDPPDRPPVRSFDRHATPSVACRLVTGARTGERNGSSTRSRGATSSASSG